MQGEVLRKTKTPMEGLIPTICHNSDAYNTPFNSCLSSLKDVSLNVHFITPSKVFSPSSLLFLTWIYQRVVSEGTLMKKGRSAIIKRKRKVLFLSGTYIYNIKEDYLFYFLRGLIENIHTLNIVWPFPYSHWHLPISSLTLKYWTSKSFTILLTKA